VRETGWETNCRCERPDTSKQKKKSLFDILNTVDVRLDSIDVKCLFYFHQL
jgi:hypothetical protein